MRNTLSPIKHKFNRPLPKTRVSGARLAEKIGVKKAAYIFAVSEETIREWVKQWKSR